MPDANGEPSSWAEAINMYAKEKSTRPRPDSEYVKPYRETRYEKSRQEVEYHPILQSFRDQPREKMAVEREQSARVHQLNKAKDRQISTESPFDILTFHDKRAALPRQPPVQAMGMTAPFNPHAERPTFRHPLDSCYQFNIVSNMPLSQHHYTAPALRPNVSEEINVTKPRLQHVAALPRDFNILSNRYVERHDDKVQLEREIQRRTAAAKYWETHDYEPLLGHYLDPTKEEQYQELVQHELGKQEMKSFNRLPPSLQKGEGFVYDITTHQVKNQSLYDKDQQKRMAKLERDAQTWQRNDSQRNAGLEKQVLSDTRAINRQSHQRYVDTFRHGFNIVDHRDFRDPQTYIPPPRTRPEPTLWQAVGPERPPPPEPVPPPPPPIAPLLPTMPDGFLERTLGSTGGFGRGGGGGGHDFGASQGSFGASGRSLAAEVAAAINPPAPVSAPASESRRSTGGLKMLAEYEARDVAPA
jgi:uncharacterized membrane protein YgcG